MQIDTTLIIAGGAILFVGIVVIWWFLKRSKIKRVDATLENLASIVGSEGGTPGYRYAKTGEPQLLMQLKPLTNCTSLIVQYGHSGGALGVNKSALNVAVYHVNQEIKTNFFLRPVDKPSSLAPRKGPRVLTGNASFDQQYVIEHGNKAEKVVRDAGFQELIQRIPNLLFFEVRQEGVKTLIWGELKSTDSNAVKLLYETLKRTADLL